MFPSRSPKIILALGKRQPASAASNSRALPARSMRIASWIVSQSFSQIGMNAFQCDFCFARSGKTKRRRAWNVFPCMWNS
jgi:hypothetical protein